MEVNGRMAQPSAHSLTLTTSDFVTWYYIFLISFIKMHFDNSSS